MFEHLGRHVDWGAHTGARHLARLSEVLGETEVTNFEYLLVDQDVGCFEVAVDDAELVEFLEAPGHLADDVEGHFLVDLASHAKPFEVSPRAVLQYEVDVVLRVYDLVELDDVGMLQLLHDRYLIVQRFLEVAITADELLLDSLDGHLASLITHCLIHLPE